MPINLFDKDFHFLFSFPARANIIDVASGLMSLGWNECNGFTAVSKHGG
jgi:hypothetical protein